MNRLNSTAFMSQQELASKLCAIDMSEETYQYGGIPVISRDNKVYVDNSDSHTIIFGSTGSKKTRMFVMPSIEILSRAGESFFVSDPKGEVYERTAGGVKERGYNVCCMNLRDFSKGISWNPFALAYDLYHSTETRKAYELVGDIVSAIFKTDNANDIFWAETSMNVVNGFILMMFEKCKREECNLKTLIRMWNDYRTSRTEFLRKIASEYKGTIIYNKLSCLNVASEKTTGSIDAYVDMGINKLAINEDFVNYLSCNSLELLDIAKNKSAVYLIVPDESDYYHFVIGLFVKQLYMVLIDNAQNNAGKEMGRRMNFILDEFCNIPEIPEFSNIITAARSRNIRFCLIVQSKKQLEDKYRNKADVILGNCTNWIYLYSREVALLNELSQLCGEVIYENGTRIPLISMFELQHLSKEDGEALVLIGRNRPCISKLLDISEYPFEYIELKEEMSEEQEEEEAPVVKSISAFSEGTENPYLYENKSDFIVKPYARKAEGKEHWLVATYRSMILDHTMANERDIESEYAMQRVYARNEDLYNVRDEIVWYRGTMRARDEYIETLEAHPEFVFLTLEELGRRAFRRIYKQGEAPTDNVSKKPDLFSFLKTDDEMGTGAKQSILAKRGEV